MLQSPSSMIDNSLVGRGGIGHNFLCPLSRAPLIVLYCILLNKHHWWPPLAYSSSVDEFEINLVQI